MRKILTLCLIHNHPHVLLGMKKKGFGEGRWNGFGGKVEGGESIEEAARREVLEEAGITVRDIEHAGQLDFHFENEENVLEVHVFRGNSFEGEPRESEEMRPQWFSVEEIPFDTMWPDDKYWIPLFLAGKKFRGKFLFKDHNTILEHELIEL